MSVEHFTLNDKYSGEITVHIETDSIGSFIELIEIESRAGSIKVAGTCYSDVMESIIADHYSKKGIHVEKTVYDVKNIKYTFVCDAVEWSFVVIKMSLDENTIRVICEKTKKILGY